MLQHQIRTNQRTLKFMLGEDRVPQLRYQCSYKGKTKVDYRCLETIALMKKLLYFNIESTTIKGKELLLMFKQYYELHQQSHPLKYLNIATKMFKWKVKAF